MRKNTVVLFHLSLSLRKTIVFNDRYRRRCLRLVFLSHHGYTFTLILSQPRGKLTYPCRISLDFSVYNTLLFCTNSLVQWIALSEEVSRERYSRRLARILTMHFADAWNFFPHFFSFSPVGPWARGIFFFLTRPERATDLRKKLREKLRSRETELFLSATRIFAMTLRKVIFFSLFHECKKYMNFYSRAITIIMIKWIIQ